LLLVATSLSCLAPRPPKGKILIEFWDYPRLPAVAEWLEQAREEYMRLNPHVHIEYTRLSWAKGGERLDIAAFAGRPPDVAGGVLQVKYVDAGLLLPVDEWLDEEIPGSDGLTWREDIHPAILRDVQWAGETWSFPWYKEGFVLLLNRDLFAERGVALPKDGAWSWDEFLGAMRRLTFDRNGDGVPDVYGIGFSTGPSKWEAYPFLFAEGMRIISEDGRRMLIDSEATRRGLRRLLALEFEEKVALPGAGGIMDDTTWSAFSGQDRRLAATSQGLWAIKSVHTINERLENFRRDNPQATNLPDPLRIAVALFPRMPGQPQSAASYGPGSLMVFNRPHDPERTREAARFARYIALEAGQQINHEAGVFPSRMSVGNIFEGDERYEHIWHHLVDAHSPPIHPAWIKLDQIIGEHIQLVLLRRLDVDEGVRRMGERCQIVLDDYWRSRDAADTGATP
jgi:multiple sugar transport system substrate-binding protein